MTTPRKYEPTDVGEQSLIDGVRPVTLGELHGATHPQFKNHVTTAYSTVRGK